ncbi:methyl-accepting chemotaxis protein [Sphingomonas morindae]|uniref:Methyl-accepting chemotaxis protein n=1 Tax=Sphingomonas morindae TaxID=1541170 RepID=A0ABY4X6V5_9SPHN|nr:methyl-accepting chemotaxis protein [Sphingomonas morindae]USI72642.1 methyl-accepting chemotaxis protein [Sphingomonas morindae]
MNNLSISRKLMLCFGVMLLVFGAVSILSVSRLGSVAGTAAELGGEKRARVAASAAIDVATSDMRVAEGAHFLLTNPVQLAQADAALRVLRARITERLAWLQSRTTDPQLRKLLRTYQEHYFAYVAKSDASLALWRRHQIPEALAAFRADRALYDNLNDTIAAVQARQAQIMTDLVAEAQGQADAARTIIVIASLAVGGLCIAMFVLLVRGIATPMRQVTDGLAALARGDMHFRLALSERTDEVGQLVQASERLRDQLAAAEQAKAEQAQLIVTSIGSGLDALSRGDLTYRVTAELQGVFAQLKSDYNGALDALNATLAAFTEAAAGISSGSAEIRQASEDLSSRTEQQAASLEETAAALSQVTTTVRAAAADAQRANGVVEAARGEAEQSGQVVKRAVEAMEGIERTAREINDIISVIDGIAFQTNLLALNAGVEAARAGDAGKGFAVVASEVRALAERSAEAAKDIKAKITASGEQVASGVDLVTETGKALGRIVASVGEISGLMGQIASSAEAQSAGLTQVNTAVSEMDSMTQQNAAMAEEATAAARSLAGQADQLSTEVARFRLTAAPRPLTAPKPVTPSRSRVTTLPRARAAGHRASAVAAAAPVLSTAEDSEAWTEF